MRQEQGVFDTVTVTVPVPEGAEFNDGYVRRHLDRETGELRSRLLSSAGTLADGRPVKVVNSYGRRLLRFESSVPSCLGKSPLELATADEVRSLIADVVAEALDLLDVEPLGEPRLARVDVARQFSVPVDVAYGGIAAIGAVLQLSVLRDAVTGGATVMGGSKETSFRLYDKTAESRLAEVDGMRTWRFEVQLRGRAARGRGLDRLDQLDEERAQEALHRAFRRARLGSAISSSRSDLRVAVQRVVDGGAKNVEQVLGYAVMRELQMLPTKHRSTTARYERAATRWALPSVLTASQAGFRLDWGSGQGLRLAEVGDHADH